jgi:hypothetical protein
LIISVSERLNMCRIQFSIAGAMKLTAIIALSVAMIRLLPSGFFQVPMFVFLILALEIAILQAAAGWPLRVFYFTFLIAGVVTTGVITAVFYTESALVPGSLYSLETAIGLPGPGPGQSWVFVLYFRYPMLAAADGCITCVIGLVPALVAAILVSRWMRRRSRRKSDWGKGIAAFLQGAFVGLGAFVCVRLTLALFFDPVTFPVYVRRGVLVASPLLGGLVFSTLTVLRLGKQRTETLMIGGSKSADGTGPGIATHNAVLAGETPAVGIDCLNGVSSDINEVRSDTGSDRIKGFHERSQIG